MTNKITVVYNHAAPSADNPNEPCFKWGCPDGKFEFFPGRNVLPSLDYSYKSTIEGIYKKLITVELEDSGVLDNTQDFKKVHERVSLLDEIDGKAPEKKDFSGLEGGSNELIEYNALCITPDVDFQKNIDITSKIDPEKVQGMILEDNKFTVSEIDLDEEIDGNNEALDEFIEDIDEEVIEDTVETLEKDVQVEEKEEVIKIEKPITKKKTSKK